MISSRAAPISGRSTVPRTAHVIKRQILARPTHIGQEVHALESPSASREPAMSHDVYLVGSVPLASAEQVFETVSAILGPKLKRIPDGETGERSDWITWLEPVFSNNRAFVLSDEIFRLHKTAPPIRRYTLRPGYTAQDVRIDNLFYADIAVQ